MSFEDVADTIRTRRTHMFVDRDRPVPQDLVRELCVLAQYAPNHKRTWPWRFALIEGDGRQRLGDTIADAMSAQGDPESKVLKTRGKYLRTPATLVVGSAAGDTPLRTAENRDATAAGVQNMLLAATAAGLATFWGSCAKGANDAVAQLCGFEEETTIVGLIYLGWAVTSVDTPQRPPVDLHLID